MKYILLRHHMAVTWLHDLGAGSMECAGGVCGLDWRPCLNMYSWAGLRVFLPFHYDD
jgi:hypothetical protein